MEVMYGYDMTHDEASGAVETLKHKHRVCHLVMCFVFSLIRRGEDHDDSKVGEGELAGFATATKNLKHTEYGTPGYQKCLDELKPLIELHHSKNRHHVQCHKNGILGMSLIDVLEMLADWKAAGERHEDGGDILRSIKINSAKHGFDKQILALLVNTAEEMGWMEGVR